MRRQLLIPMTLLFSTQILSSQPALAQDALDLSPGSTTTGLGSSFSLSLDAQFASIVIGGEIRALYDPGIVRLTGIVAEAGYGDDPDLRCPPVPLTMTGRGCPGDVDFVAFGNLSGLPTGKVADLVFEAIGIGSTTIKLDGVSPFSDSVGNPVVVDLGAADVNVPEPGLTSALAAGSLALGLVADRGRRRSRRVSMRAVVGRVPDADRALGSELSKKAT